MYKEDLALNNLQRLIYHKTKNLLAFFMYSYTFYAKSSL